MKEYAEKVERMNVEEHRCRVNANGVSEDVVCERYTHQRAQLLHGAAIVFPTTECSGLRLHVIE